MVGERTSPPDREHTPAEAEINGRRHSSDRPRNGRKGRWNPSGLAVLFVAGALLLAGIAYLARDPAFFSEPTKATGVPSRTGDVEPLPIPLSLAGLSARSHLSGQAALDEIYRLHRGDFPLIGAGVAAYENGRATVWIGGAENAAQAGQITDQMTESIARADTPFAPVGERRSRGVAVHELRGMGQVHFYFQIGDRIFWLAVEPDIADQGLSDLLDFALDAD